MKRIFKYAVPVGDDVSITLPTGAEVLTVQMQLDVPQLWALVDPDSPPQTRGFHWRGTGHDADNLGRYVGTIQAAGGRLIFHLFEVQP